MVLALAALLLPTGAAGNPAPPADPTPVADQPRPAIIDPELLAAQTAAGPEQPVEYLVWLDDRPDLAAIAFDRPAVVAALQETAQASQAPVVAHLRAQGAEVVNTFWLANAVLVRSPAEPMRSVTALPAVRAVAPVGEVTLPDPDPAPDPAGPATVEDRTWGVDRIGAHRVWDELDVDGTGIRVATLDTGVAIDHPDLAGKLATDDPADPAYPGGWMEFDAAGNPVGSQPHDTLYHGTHVAGTIHGGDASGVAIGVAPGATMMHGLVLPGGTGTWAQVIAGMQWAVAPYDRHGDPAGAPAQVVNMSLGPQEGGIVDALVEPVRNLYAAGVLPVASAGNCGPGCHGSPGNVFESLAVGASDVDDDVADFSGGGLVPRDAWADPPAEWPASWTVPDVSAPGVDVLSAFPGGAYLRLEGTSMASPHVAGAAALMRSGDPGLGIDEIAGTLADTSFFDARHGDDRPNGRFGHGRIDAFQAVAQVVLDSGVTGRVTDAGSGEPVAGVQVEAVELGATVQVGADGGYDLRIPPGTHTLELSWSGQVVATVSDVVVVEGARTERDVALGGAAGRVVAAGGDEPVAGVRVEVVETGVEVRTDRDGRYRLYLAPDSYTLDLAAFGYEDSRTPGVAVVEGQVTTVDVDLVPLPTGTVAGTVTLATSGRGVPGVTVELPGTPVAAVTTGADGGYTIAGVPVGSYPVAALPTTFSRPEDQQVTVEPDAVAAVDFTLRCGDQCHPAELWEARYEGDGPTLAIANDLDVGPDGEGVYVTGLSQGSRESGTGDDFATVAYDAAAGEERWVARYDGPAGGRDGAAALRTDPGGAAVYVTGSSTGAGTNRDYATIAYDATTGDQRWVARYDGTGSGADFPVDLQVSPDGSAVYVTGRSRGDGTGDDFATVAYDPATGEQRWATRYDPGGGLDQARAVDVSPDGALVYVTGLDFADGTRAYATVAYDAATGEQVWVARYTSPFGGTDRVWALAVSPDGSAVYVSGDSVGEQGRGFATVAYHAATGEQRWVTRYETDCRSTSPCVHAMAVSSDAASVFITGDSPDEGTGDQFVTAAYDAASGDERWVTRYAGPGDFDAPSDLAVSPDDSTVYVTGQSRVSEVATEDYLTVGYDAASGDERWVARYAGPEGGRDTGNALAVSPDGSAVYVTGLADSIPNVRSPDYLTRAYDPEVGDGFAVFVPWDLRVPSGVALAGEPAAVQVTVTNVGTAAGRYEAVLLVDGQAEAATPVSLGPGAATDLTWTVTRDEPGAYRVRVGPVTGQLRVLGCDELVRGSRTGPLAVTDGVTCLAEAARVTGRVAVHPGAGLVTTGAIVTGPVSATGAELVELHRSRFTGGVTVTGTTGGLTLSDNRVTGRVHLRGNTTGETPIVVSGNRITGPLACMGNQPPPVDGGVPNTVTGATSGQCAGW